MQRLNRDDRAIRQSAGIPIWRFLPFLLPIIAILIMSWDPQLFQQCLGRPMPIEGRMAIPVRFIAAIPCSPYYVHDIAHHWWVIAIFVAGIALAIPQILWLRRHKAYWDAFREKARLKRAEKRAKQKEHTDGDT